LMVLGGHIGRMPRTAVVSGDSKLNVQSFHEQTRTFRQWVPFAKGGAFSPYYSDLHLLVNWRNDGQEIKARINPDTQRPYSNVWQLGGTEKEFFFRPGLTWSLRSILGFSMWVYPAGAMFGHKGPIAFVDPVDLPSFLAICNSRIRSVPL
jgi:hypothetical protein